MRTEYLTLSPETCPIYTGSHQVFAAGGGRPRRAPRGGPSGKALVRSRRPHDGGQCGRAAAADRGLGARFPARYVRVLLEGAGRGAAKPCRRRGASSAPQARGSRWVDHVYRSFWPSSNSRSMASRTLSSPALPPPLCSQRHHGPAECNRLQPAAARQGRADALRAAAARAGIAPTAAVARRG